MAKYRTCVFCNRNDSPPSKEDVLPRWMAREFPADGVFTVVRPDLGKTFRPRGKIVTSNKACRRCNNEWMSRLESAAKPILKPLMEGKPTVLTQNEQLIIARWFIKTSIMYELSQRKREPCFFTGKECQELFKSLSVPLHTAMFLARYNGTRAGRIVDAQVSLEARGASGSEMHDGYSITLAIKQLALQLFTFRWPKKLDFRQLAIPDTHNWAGAVLPFWPIPADLSWPPTLFLDDQGFELFAKRWATIDPTP